MRLYLTLKTPCSRIVRRVVDPEEYWWMRFQKGGVFDRLIAPCTEPEACQMRALWFLGDYFCPSLITDVRRPMRKAKRKG